MSARIIAAVIRMDLIRSRRTLLWGSGLALLGCVSALALDGGLAIAAAVVVGITIFGTVMFAPLSTLLVEKLLGTLELDRTLPLPTRVLAAARLLSASVRTLPVLLFLSTLAVFIARKSAPVGTSMLVFGVCALLLLYWSALWMGYGLLARFDFKKLMWLPAAVWLTLVLAPDFVVDPIKLAIVDRVTALVTAAVADPARLPALGLAVFGVAALCFGVALLLVTSGLRRYQPDPMALQGPVEEVPREELTPVGRGVVFAIMRLRLRLATPQIRRELLFVAAMIAVLLADSFGVSAVSTLAEMSRVYLPVLAFLMPGAIGLNLLPARQLGIFEGLQQLPGPRRDVALGHLLTILLLAVPAVVIWTVARAIEGSVPDAERTLRMFAVVSATSWLIAAVAVWATRRRMIIAFLVVVGIPATLFFGGRWLLPKLGVDVSPHVAALFTYWGENRAWLMPTSTIVAFGLAVAVGLALFTHGLRTYQPKAPGS